MSQENALPRELTAYAYRHLTRILPPSTPHPAADEVEADVRTWAQRTGVYGPDQEHQLARRRIGHLAGWCMPQAPTPVVRLAARYLAWVFVFDDTVGEDAKRLNRALVWDLPGLLEAGVAHPAAPAGGLTAALAAVRRDIVDAGGEPLLPQLAVALRHYLAGCAREAPWRASRVPPALGTYLHDRVHTSGGHPLYLHRLAPGMPPLSEPLPPPVTGLAELAFLIGALANDLIGFTAEQHLGDPVNAVTVLAHEYCLPLPDAYRATVVLHASHKHHFDTGHARLLADPALTEPQRRLVHAIGGWVAGSAAALEPYWQHALAHQP
ncbi:hypothetical protein [Streptomyces sp. NPDC052042]|uniref:terpene synthase family protein n=1 Tax=Streptomyces sp. NPDC052042 TaxID=3365683 RepID=UPI0037D66A56